jgi:hypothetical protein
MKAIERGVGPVRDRLVFFPDEQQLRRLATGVGAAEVVRIRQTTAPTEGLPHLASAGTFRTACIELIDDADALLARMKKDTRREIRIAQAMEGLTLSCGGPADRDAFVRLYGSFVRQKGHTKPMTDRRAREYETVADIWVARLQDEPLVVRMMVADHDAGRVRFLYEGTSRFDRSERSRLSAPVGRWMHWRQMSAYAAKGIGKYDLGGIGDGTSPIARFKLSLGGEPAEDRSCVLAGVLARPFVRWIP